MFTVFITVNCARLFIADPYALDLTNNQFQSIDLSSLEEIRGDGLRYAVNQQLCYVGDLLSYLADPNNQTQCLSRQRRPPNECSEWTACTPKLDTVIIVNLCSVHCICPSPCFIIHIPFTLQMMPVWCAMFSVTPPSTAGDQWTTSVTPVPTTSTRTGIYAMCLCSTTTAIIIHNYM